MKSVQCVLLQSYEHNAYQVDRIKNSVFNAGKGG